MMTTTVKTNNLNNYFGNANLKGANVTIDWTPEMVKEWVKCKNDPMYFARNYIKIVHVDNGLVTIEPYEYQEEIVRKFENTRRLIIVASRQCGKCVSINTLITLRNKNTGEIVSMTIGEFYEQEAEKRSKANID
jgi:superfamily II DNA or RNA helicase